MPTLTFRGSIASLTGAIKIGPEVMRITLEVPSSEIENAIAVTLMQTQPLKITLEVEEIIPDGREEAQSRTSKTWP